MIGVKTQCHRSVFDGHVEAVCIPFDDKPLRRIFQHMGQGPEPSILTGSFASMIQDLRDTYAPQADINLSQEAYLNATWGDKDDFKIVYRAGNLLLDGNVTGAGLLIVDGKFQAKNTFTWHGIVLCLGMPQEDAQLDNNCTIYGAFLFGSNGTGDVELKKETKILYCSWAINKLNRAMEAAEVVRWREL